MTTALDKLYMGRSYASGSHVGIQLASSLIRRMTSTACVRVRT